MFNRRQYLLHSFTLLFQFLNPDIIRKYLLRNIQNTNFFQLATSEALSQCLGRSTLLSIALPSPPSSLYPPSLRSRRQQRTSQSPVPAIHPLSHVAACVYALGQPAPETPKAGPRSWDEAGECCNSHRPAAGIQCLWRYQLPS